MATHLSKEPQQFISIVEQEVLSALYAAHETYRSFSTQGIEYTGELNQWGDKALLIDVRAEEAVIESLKRSNLPIRIISEEHGTVDLSTNPEFVAFLDGIDGSGDCRRNYKTGIFGTMLALFKGSSPTYSDYLCNGIFQHALDTIYLASKGEGALKISHGTKEQILPDQTARIFNPNTSILIDHYWDTVKETFVTPLETADYQWSCIKVCSASYARVASGKTQLYLECTRKHNLEPAVAYGLINESGAVMVDINGNDIGRYKLFEFGWEPEDHEPIICAATQDLALSFIDFLKKKAP